MDEMMGSGDQRRCFMVGDYRVGRQLGVGSFSTVWHGCHRVTGAEVAIKEVVTARLDLRLQESLNSEIVILKKIDHPNIIRLHDMIEEPGKIYIILEYCKGGDLSMYIKQRCGRMPEATAKHFMQQLATGLKVLRENRVIHRDLKPQNLLLSTSDENSLLKIADFGLARSLQPRGLAETKCGSPLYMAPEVMQHRKYDAKADLWSVGVILFQLVTGKTPFTGCDERELLENIVKCTDLRFPSEPRNLSPDCVDLCRNLLQFNPVQRLIFEEFFNHPFLNQRQTEEPSRNTLSQEAREISPLSEINTSLSNQMDTFKSSSDDHLKGSTTKMFGSLYGPPKVVDSMESIDQDYVLVSDSLIDLLSTSVHASESGHLKSKSDHKPVVSTKMNSASGNSPPRFNPEISQGSLDRGDPLAKSSADFINRIKSLQNFASAITQLVKGEIEEGKKLEAFSIQLVILAIWKQALDICHAHAASAVERYPSHETEKLREISKVQHIPDVNSFLGNSRMLLDFFFQIESTFLSEVGNAEELAKVIEPGKMKMPDAMELIYQSALAFGRDGAVDEYLGNAESAEIFYSKAVHLLEFLVVEAPTLILNPPFSLTNSDRHRIQSYIDVLKKRKCLLRFQKDVSLQV